MTAVEWLLVAALLVASTVAVGAVQAARIYRRHLGDLARRHDPHVYAQLMRERGAA